MAAGSETQFIDAWLDERANGSKKSNSLLVSMLGDIVVPHGGEIALSSLVHAGELLGIGEQTIRSAANRLAGEGWITGETLGRRSFFRLTDFGRIRFEVASRRIYQEAEQEWAGDWQIVMIARSGNLSTQVLDDVNRDLTWAGFGKVSPGVFLRPLVEGAGACEELNINAVAAEHSLCFISTSPPCCVHENSMKNFVCELWDFRTIESRYQRFVSLYDPVLAAVWTSDRRIDGATAVKLRTYLNHDFRRIRLIDPQLPLELLPEKWIGGRALYVAHEIYDLLVGPSEAYIMEHFEGQLGRLPQLTPDFYDRFGGLSR